MVPSWLGFTQTFLLNPNIKVETKFEVSYLGIFDTLVGSRCFTFFIIAKMHFDDFLKEMKTPETIKQHKSNQLHIATIF